jgi:hypothetical protein
MGQIIYQVEAERHTSASAVKDFARTYWDIPRKTRKLSTDGTFQMVGGTGATYKIEMIPASRTSVALYQISKLEMNGGN